MSVFLCVCVFLCVEHVGTLYALLRLHETAYPTKTRPPACSYWRFQPSTEIILKHLRPWTWFIPANKNTRWFFHLLSHQLKFADYIRKANSTTFLPTAAGSACVGGREVSSVTFASFRSLTQEIQMGIDRADHKANLPWHLSRGEATERHSGAAAERGGQTWGQPGPGGWAEGWAHHHQRASGAAAERQLVHKGFFSCQVVKPIWRI